MMIALIALAIGVGLFVLITVVSLTGSRDPGGRLSGNAGPVIPHGSPGDDADLDI